MDSGWQLRLGATGRDATRWIARSGAVHRLNTSSAKDESLMLLEEFRHIAETAVPQPIQSRVVTPDEARAVLTSFGKLSDDKLRIDFLRMPVENIIEFSVTQAKKRPMLATSMIR